MCAVLFRFLHNFHAVLEHSDSTTVHDHGQKSSSWVKGWRNPSHSTVVCWTSLEDRRTLYWHRRNDSRRSRSLKILRKNRQWTWRNKIPPLKRVDVSGDIPCLRVDVSLLTPWNAKRQRKWQQQLFQRKHVTVDVTLKMLYFAVLLNDTNRFRWEVLLSKPEKREVGPLKK